MLAWLLATALAAPVPVRDIDDATYLVDQFRADEALPWLTAQLEHPTGDPVQVWMGWLDALAAAPSAADRRIVREQVRAWATAPGAPPGAHAVLAVAEQLAVLSTGSWASSPWSEPTQASCAAAWSLLDPLPEAGLDRWYSLWVRARLQEDCGWPDDGDAMTELALSGEVGAWRQAWYALRTGADVDVIPGMRQAMDDRPAVMRDVAWVVAKPPEGPNTEAAVALLLERARAVAADEAVESLSTLQAAATILDAADDVDTARSVRQRLALLDPDNRQNNRRLASPSPTVHDEDAPPDPETLIDPEARLAALLKVRRGSLRTWDRGQHEAALAETYQALGRPDDALAALDRRWRVERGYRSNVDFALAAVAADDRLAHAERAATVAVDAWQAMPPTGHGVSAAEEADDTRRHAAHALVARARVRQARDRTKDAIADLRQAMILDPHDGATRIRLGLLLVDTDPRSARDALASGLALGSLGDEDDDNAARAVLEGLLDTTGTWAPDGVYGYVQSAHAALALAPTVRAGADTPALPPLPDLVVRIDGVDTHLADIEGPVVLDLWATWCGPCIQSLPHLDRLARRHHGTFTFLAVSVDDDPQEAVDHLTKVGAPAFVAAWGGPALMKQVGVDGIPHTFVLDADHQVVAVISGYGAGDVRVDEAVARVLGR